MQRAWCMRFIARRHRLARVLPHPDHFVPSDDDGRERQAYRLCDLGDTQKLPRSIFCPILHMPMCDPVIAADGFSYERSALARWLATHDTSPITGKCMGTAVLANHSLRATIAELVVPRISVEDA